MEEGSIMQVKVGDIIGLRRWDSDGQTDECDIYYLILKTRNRFRYLVLFLNDGTLTELDKAYVNKYGVKVV
jgi:hypothetical protein